MTTMSDRQHMTYEDFGRRFFEVAVTEERVGAAIGDIAGEAFEMGPICQGPGGIAKVTARVKIQHPRVTRHVEGDVEIIGKLVEKMAGIGGFIAAPAVVGAAHVSSDSQSLHRPAVPLTIRIESDRHHGRFGGGEPLNAGTEKRKGEKQGRSTWRPAPRVVLSWPPSHTTSPRDRVTAALPLICMPS